ncbi:AfsR/SARP family transcriptional regulator [Kribbella antiqua]|uniref:AfsR/SARP family transcriptional regulator n=1 Tax=Kribbella antiqua TaxID=2512217 RepID=UPI0010525AC5|nr:AfsR/SARP family transcriptional regulator [Kribbella antiqua]
MEFRLLGPVQIWSGGKPVGLRRRQERLLLAVLLLEPGKAVPAERLVDLLWPEAMPDNPKRALQVYVSRLRSVLAPDVRLTSGSEGYAVLGRTDIEEFTALVAQARRTDDLEHRSKLLTDALALWRGPALADVTTEDVRRRLCAGLEESRWAAEELRVSTELALGHHLDLLPDLARLTAAQPARETFAAASMLALYRSGRQADALTAYAELVRHLDEELGVEPGAEVRELQVAILRQDPSLDVVAETPVPRELPADVSVLVGRDDVLVELAEELLTKVRPPGVPAVVCLYGAAGTGKSAAAVRLAHQLAGKYPDGQLFARLQDVNGQGLAARTVLGQLLRSLGVDGSELPESVEARSAMLRSRLADKNVLLVFDDALDAGQLRPLLPAGGGCGVIVTSRQPLLGLEDAVHRELRPLPDETSAELLGALSGLGADKVTEVVPHCAGLPLALRIVGARLALIREDVGDVVRTLADESRRLDYLVAGDRAVRASLDLSLSVASPDARQLFARLALVGADEFGAWVSAPLLDTDESTAAHVFEGLVSLGLVQQRRLHPPRYGLHGLVRSRAAELSGQSETADVEHRYLDTVLRLVTIADEEIGQMPPTMELDSGGGIDLPVAAASAAEGAAWLDVEAPVVRGAVELAVRRNPRLAGMLAVRFNGYLTVRDEREVRESVLRAAIEAAVRAGEVELEAELNRCLFGAMAQGGAAAEDLAVQADRCLDSARRSGSLPQRISALNQAGFAAGAAGDYEQQLRLGEEMLALVDANPGNEESRPRALDVIGGALIFLGRIRESQARRREARALGAAGTRIRAIRSVLLAETLLADIDLGASHVPELTAILGEAREIVERIGDELGIAHVDNIEAQLLILTRQLDNAERLLEHAAEILGRRPDASGASANAIGRARLAAATGKPDEARRILATALGDSPPIDYIRYELKHQQKLLGLA